MSCERLMFLQLRAVRVMSPPRGENGEQHDVKVPELGRFTAGALISQSL